VRSHLIALLVSLDRQYTAANPVEAWEEYYARELVREFSR
jgi:hypothetical protein